MHLSRQMHREDYPKDEELCHAQNAVEQALELGDTLLYARALNNFGLIYRFHKNYEQALPLHIKAYELVKNLDVKPLFKMMFANNTGVAGRYEQQFDLATSYYFKALRIAEREKDRKNIAIASNGLGNTIGHLPGRREKAIEYFKRSLKAEKKRGNSLGMAMNYLSIGDYYITKGKFDIARDYLKKMYDINKERDDIYGLALTNEYRGICFLKEGKQLQRAFQYFQKALSQFRTMNNKQKEASLLLNLGNLKFKQNQNKSAKNFYLDALAIAKTLNQDEMLRDIYLKLSKVMETENESQKALLYIKKSEVYKDSIKLHKQNVKIEALSRKYDLSKKENQIQILQKNKALQESKLNAQTEKLKRRHIFEALLILGFVSLLIIFLLQYRNHRLKKKSTAKLVAEEKQKLNAIHERNLARAETLVTRLRINPHFLFNSLNAITFLIQSDQKLKAIKYLKVFSRYTRMVLETSKKQDITLREELDLAQYYLTLEENRFEENVSFSLSGIEGTDLDDIYIPPLLLQPFLENAIWHGLLPSEKTDRKLEIKVQHCDGGLQILIDDNGIGRQNKNNKTPVKRHKSMGTAMIEERIDLFNESHDTQMRYSFIDKTNKAGEPAGTCVLIELITAREKSQVAP